MLPLFDNQPQPERRPLTETRITKSSTGFIDRHIHAQGRTFLELTVSRAAQDTTGSGWELFKEDPDGMGWHQEGTDLKLAPHFEK